MVLVVYPRSFGLRRSDELRQGRPPREPSTRDSAPPERLSQIDVRPDPESSVAFAIFFAGFNPPILFDANALLFILVVSEAFRSASQIFQYRRGA